MSEPDELYPPVQYGPLWMLLALGVIVLVIAAIWAVLFFTRSRRAAQRLASGPVTADALTLLRHEYLDAVDDIERRWTGKQIGARQANFELSRMTRAFVNEFSGIEAPVLALEDLVEMGVHPALIDAIKRHYYPSIFGRGPAIDPAAGAAAARKVVSEWH